jgi:Zn-finger nucleic acid-binding protein
MEVHPYYGPGNVVVDSCCHCGLVWLDAGEISMIETAPGAR